MINLNNLIMQIEIIIIQGLQFYQIDKILFWKLRMEINNSKNKLLILYCYVKLISIIHSHLYNSLICLCEHIHE